MGRSKKLIGIIVGAIIAIGCVWYIISSSDSELENESPADKSDVVRNVVTDFGEVLKNVSLLSPAASEQIQEQYGAYVSDRLLAGWKTNPENAPGRLTSSPWPGRIEITNMEREGAGKYKVNGQILLITSLERASEANDNAGIKPIQLTVEKRSGMWQITAFRLTDD